MNYVIMLQELAGRDLTKVLEKMMSEVGFTVSSSSESEIVRNIKETMCYVAKYIKT